MTDFHLKDGKLLFGKLVDEDKNKITIEQLEGSKIIVSIYSKRDIDPRTLQIKTVPEYKYYIDLAEYFSGRTWDFTDDPDDFIQAIRCYEKAKLLTTGAETQDNDRIGQIDEKIKQLQSDREVWTREVESRAKLKKLEFEAEMENRLKELEAKVTASTQKVNESVDRLDKAITQIQDNQRKLEQSITVMEQETSRRLNIMAEQAEANRRLTDPFYFAPRYRYPYGYYDRPGY
jgi:type I site-specific restriction endonuclease